MNRHIEGLNKMMAQKEQERTTIRDQIRELQERKLTDEQAKQTALADGNNDAYLAAHKRIQDHDAQIAALQDLLNAKEQISSKKEIVSALNQAVADFENDRQRAIKKYIEEKKKLAEMYANLCHEESEMKTIRANWMATGDISAFTGEVREVKNFETDYRAAIDYFKNELYALGHDVAEIKMGRQTF